MASKQRICGLRKGLFCLLTAALPGGALAQTLLVDDFELGDLSRWSSMVGSGPALLETFDGDPTSPSTDLLPSNFDFSVTHRTHPEDHDPDFRSYLADHGSDCSGPSTPSGVMPQHEVVTSHRGGGSQPDPSFYVCRNHMMSTMGDVEGYSVTSFWPRQEFDWSDGGRLSFDVNINDGHPRSWWEILLAPRDQMKVGSAQDWLPIDETYPDDRIVLSFSEESRRSILVGSGQLAPGGWTEIGSDWRRWVDVDPSDPALDSRAIRRKMIIEMSDEAIEWSVEMADGTFDLYRIDLDEPLPFTRGLVMFKTHAYTPEKDANFDQYSFHWDNIEFDGPVVGRYDAYEYSGIVYLEANGNRPIGDHATATIDLPRTGPSPVLFGELHGANIGQVLLSINGGPTRVVHPYDYVKPVGCGTSGWGSFRLPLAPGDLVVGTNTFRWTVGPRPSCLDGEWDGFSVKGLEVQIDQ